MNDNEIIERFSQHLNSRFHDLHSACDCMVGYPDLDRNLVFELPRTLELFGGTVQIAYSNGISQDAVGQKCLLEELEKAPIGVIGHEIGLYTDAEEFDYFDSEHPFPDDPNFNWADFHYFYPEVLAVFSRAANEFFELGSGHSVADAIAKEIPGVKVSQDSRESFDIVKIKSAIQTGYLRDFKSLLPIHFLPGWETQDGWNELWLNDVEPVLRWHGRLGTSSNGWQYTTLDYDTWWQVDNALKRISPVATSGGSQVRSSVHLKRSSAISKGSTNSMYSYRPTFQHMVEKTVSQLYGEHGTNIYDGALDEFFAFIANKASEANDASLLNPDEGLDLIAIADECQRSFGLEKEMYEPFFQTIKKAFDERC